ncbi:MAG: hypothetical protein IKK10_00955 [Clostridia bacterium]|nr:hypothetical protein [Clostridia bacterium]
MTEDKRNLNSIPTDEELELINKYTRREFKAEEVYVFSLTLCDNDIDRDFERFTVEALFELEKLFVGKTGIVDHESRSKNQTARIFKCRVEAVEGKKTATGDDYFRLAARAYIPVTDGNRETILSIDSGIRKEVSVGCAVEESLCSICGKPFESHGCNHQKGKSYDGKLCFAELMNPYDAYEWSFVAVPAQREAGVTKSFKKLNGRNEKTMEGIMKSLEKRKEVALTKAECEKLFDYIRDLEKDAKAGKEYRKSLEAEFTRLMALLEPEISDTAVKAATTGLDTKSLKEFIAAFSKKAEGVFPLKPQLCKSKAAKSKIAENREFTI